MQQNKEKVLWKSIKKKKENIHEWRYLSWWIQCNPTMPSRWIQRPHKYLSDEADNGMVAIPRNLVDDIILELSICHGAYCTDKEDIVKKLDNDLWFKMDESQIINKIKKFI